MSERDIVTEARRVLKGASRIHALHDSDSKKDEDVTWLIEALADECERLRERFSVTCNNCGERYLGPKDEALHGYNICNMSRCVRTEQP